MSIPTQEVLVRVNIARMIANAKAAGAPLDDAGARDRLTSWGFRHFGQFWRGDEAALAHLHPDEVDQVDPVEETLNGDDGGTFAQNHLGPGATEWKGPLE